MKTQSQLLNSILIIALSAFFKLVSAQAPNLQWQKCIGGSDDEFVQNMIKLNDGNYLLCGATASADGDIKAKHGFYDAFLMKIDGAGNTIWKKTYGGTGVDAFYHAVEASNGNIYAIGSTTSDDDQVHGNHGGEELGDVWIAIVSSNGKLLSQHCYGGSGDEYALGITLSSDNKVVFSAATNSNDGDVTNNHGDWDGWVVKLKANGAIKWETTVGDTSYDDLYSIAEVNGNFLAAGTNAIYASTSVENLEDFYNAHAVLLSKMGHVIWYHIYGGSASDDCNYSTATSDGNAVLVGHVASGDGDTQDNYGFNCWMWKIDVAHNGNIIWQTYFGTPGDSAALFNVVETNDGGFIGVGAIGPDDNPPYETWDAYAGKVDENGNLLWTKQFGGSYVDVIYGVAEENDGSILLAGNTASNDGDVSGNHGGPEDCWLVNLGENGERTAEVAETDYIMSDLRNYPNPFSNSTTISFNVATAQNVSLQIFNETGKLIRTLANEQMSEGAHTLTWNARDENGNEVSEGICFLRMQTESEVKTIAVSVVK